MAIGMALLFCSLSSGCGPVCCARGNSCWPWPGRSAIVILPNASISAAAMRWPASVWRLTTCQKSWRKAIQCSNDGCRKTAGLEQKNEILAFCGRPTVVCTPAPRFVSVFHRCSTACRADALRDIEVRVYDFEDEDNHQEFVCHSDLECDDKGCYLCPRDLPPRRMPAPH